MADMATQVAGSELLSRKAAWAHDRCGDGDSQRLSSMALLFATEAANNVGKEALHLFGGYGFMLEYDIQLYFRRAKAWPLVFGPPVREPEFLAELLTSTTNIGG
jgi:alkylation response protein AidB-like acyl-CoA dehydrogenase